jgi:hypothetical protein
MPQSATMLFITVGTSMLAVLAVVALLVYRYHRHRSSHYEGLVRFLVECAGIEPRRAWFDLSLTLHVYSSL